MARARVLRSCCAALLLVSAVRGGEPVSLRYRFAKGMAYVETVKRSFKLTLLAGGKQARFDTRSEWELRRTVLETDSQERPASERVEVRRATREVVASPDQPVGVTADPFQGRRFVWKNGRLHDAGGDVTKKYPRLATHLRNWRDARLPDRPVAVGDRWEVSAARFMQAIGQAPPEGTEGKAVFGLEAVKDGVARISIDFALSYKANGLRFGARQRGIWRFDTVRGRDLSLELKGQLQVDGGRSGSGTLALSRTLNFSPDDSR